MEESNSVGRPPLFKTNTELEVKLSEYYETCKPQKVKDPETGEEYMQLGQNPTITGLAYYLGFESRQSFYDYEIKGEFTYTIKRARLFIESNYEQALHGRNPAGPIFALKNFGWTDRQEMVTRNVNYNTELTQDEIKKISETLDDEV